MSDPKPNPREWQELLDDARPWYRTLGESLRAFLAPPVVFITNSKPVKVADMWAGGMSIGQLRRSEMMSALAHALVLALITIPFLNGTIKPPTERSAVQPVLDLREYLPALSPARLHGDTRGGGSGGERNPLPPSRGRLPRFTLFTQLTPPAAVIRNLNPALPAEPTLVMPPEVRFPTPDVTAYGDPTSNALIPSGGPGRRGGIGTECCGGVGSGEGPHYGPGKGPYRIGDGVSSPVCVYCPQPEFSDEARKARHQGRVMLWAVVDEQGRVRDIRVQQSLGMGLDEEAIRTVQSWRFKPAERLGKSVPVLMSIQVDFHLY